MISEETIPEDLRGEVRTLLDAQRSNNLRTCRFRFADRGRENENQDHLESLESHGMTWIRYLLVAVGSFASAVPLPFDGTNLGGGK